MQARSGVNWKYLLISADYKRSCLQCRRLQFGKTNPPLTPEVHPVTSTKVPLWTGAPHPRIGFLSCYADIYPSALLVLDLTTANKRSRFCRSELAVSSSLCFLRWSAGSPHRCQPAERLSTCRDRFVITAETRNMCVWETVLEQSQPQAEKSVILWVKNIGAALPINRLARLIYLLHCLVPNKKLTCFSCPVVLEALPSTLQGK